MQFFTDNALWSNWPKRGCHLSRLREKKNKRGGGNGGEVQEINLEMLNHFMLFLHFSPFSFDLSSN